MVRDNFSEVMVPLGDKLPPKDIVQKETMMKTWTFIEGFDAEEEIINSLLMGKSKIQVCDEFNKAHKEELAVSKTGKILIPNDIDNFIEKSPYVMKFLQRRYEGKAAKLLKAQERCQEVLADVLLRTRDLIDKYDTQGDNMATIAAIRALNSTMETYADLMGYRTKTINLVPVNITNQISRDNQELARRVVEVSFVDEEGKSKQETIEVYPEKEKKDGRKDI